MTELPDNILHLPQYQVLGCKSTDDEMHFQVDVLEPGEYLVLENGFDHQYGLGGQDGVFLFTAEGVKVDEAVWPADGAKNASWCRLPNGSGDFQVCETATFGAANE